MTQLLEKAIQEASKLPGKEQDIIASFVLEEIHSEIKWEQLFEKSQTTLSSLADEALTDFDRGETKPLKFSDE